MMEWFLEQEPVVRLGFLLVHRAIPGKAARIFRKKYS